MASQNKMLSRIRAMDLHCRMRAVYLSVCVALAIVFAAGSAGAQEPAADNAGAETPAESETPQQEPAADNAGGQTPAKQDAPQQAPVADEASGETPAESETPQQEPAADKAGGEAPAQQDTLQQAPVADEASGEAPAESETPQQEPAAVTASEEAPAGQDAPQQEPVADEASEEAPADKVPSPEEKTDEKKRQEPVKSAKRRPMPRKRADIHAGRQKDPPELYFKLGLQYFNNGDFKNAIINFNYASKADPQPQYLYWIGKTYGQFGQHDTMLTIMKEILTTHPKSDVADDALFEIAFHYQGNDDYHMARQKYEELVEQYPQGVSFSSGEEFAEVCRARRQLMRGEIVSALRVLGYKGATPEDTYRTFQKKNGLEENGQLNQKTVRAIKQKYQEKLNQDAKLKAQQEYVRQARIWAMIITATLASNLLFIIIIRTRIKKRNQHLAHLEGKLADLNTTDI
jgi:tetratricopeptide (TPR) repeat protein